MASDAARGRRARPWWWLALIALTIVACSGGDSPRSPHPGQGVYVPAVWTLARQISGHDVHVVRKHVACNMCHSIGDSEMGPVRPERCATCHEKQAQLSHATTETDAQLGGSSKTNCTFCHRFTDDPTIEAFEALPGGQPLNAHAHQAGDCAHCHLTAQGTTPAVQVHDTEKCLSCHRPHEDGKPVSAPCANCHADVQSTHGSSTARACTTCHQKQHAKASEALATCVSCHSSQKPVVAATALFESGHRACVGCHRPHEFAKEQAAPCRSCHADLVVLGGARATGHQQCTNCHSPHDVKGGPEQACARCHQNQHSDHPKQGVVGTCVGCHDPHPSGAPVHGGARACSTCHQAAAKDTDFHAGVACQRCHAPHDFVREASDRRACSACHAAELGKVAALGGHQACQSCHAGLPHRPLLPVTSCGSCHAGEQSRAVPAHAKCVGCHDPHDGKQANACSSCHKAEQASAPPGHQACTSCHEPHSGSRVAAPCAKCHANQAQSKHGQLSATCSGCHRPHGPSGVSSPPACSSCHKQQSLSGLHQQPKHAPCRRCHGGHALAAGAMHDVCLSCHTDRKQHFPDAPSCSACHLFTKTR